MADIVSPEKRSQNMSAIRSKNTKPEVYLRKLLFAQGYRYRIADKSVPGHPDIFLRKYNTAIFVNGCFWHRHPGCKYAYTPKSRVEFWQKKFDDNVRRDSAVKAELLEHGIKCLIVWECTIKRKAGLQQTDLTGAKLMQTAFSPNKLLLRLNECVSTSEQNEQSGYMQILAGCMVGIRNPRAHDSDWEDTEERSLQLLSFANHLMERILVSEKVDY